MSTISEQMQYHQTQLQNAQTVYSLHLRECVECCDNKYKEWVEIENANHLLRLQRLVDNIAISPIEQLTFDQYLANLV